MIPSTLTIDPARVRRSEAVRAAAGAASLLILTGRALTELVAELGGEEQAVRFLTDVATTIGHPIGANVPNGPDGSRSLFLAPDGWTVERLSGWVAGHHGEIEAAFGPGTPIHSEDA